MRTNRDVINEKSINISGCSVNIYASDSLIDEAIENESELYINLAYTNYGGSLIDKYLIVYLIEKQSQDIVYETTSWSGVNALVFGETAKEIKGCMDNGCILGYDDFQEYFYSKENEERSIAASGYIDNNDIPKSKHQVVYDFFDNCTVEPFGVDYCETDLKELLEMED